MAEKTTPRERAAASKSRGDKSRAVPVAAALGDVVPGRLSRAEWLALAQAERGDADVADVLAELLARVMDGCARAHATRERVPFTVGWARDALLLGARWRFPARDEGDADDEADAGSWREDQEPQPLAPDSWAEGSIPVLTPGQEEVSSEVAPCQDTRQDPPAVADPPSVQPPCPSWVPTAGTVLPVPGPCPPELPPDEVAIAPRPHKGKPPRARPPLPRPVPVPRSSHGDVEGSETRGATGHMALLLPPPPSCTSPATTQLGGPLCGAGTIPGVPKLGPGRRPERWIWPRVEVLDPEPKPLGRPRGAHGHSRAGEPLAKGGTRLPPSGPGSPQPRGPPQLRSLLGSAQLAPGVTVRGGGSVRRGLHVPAHGEDEEETGAAEQDLRPIPATVPFPPLAAGQVTRESGY